MTTKRAQRTKRDALDAYCDFALTMQISALRRAHERMRPRLRAMLATAALAPVTARRKTPKTTDQSKKNNKRRRRTAGGS